MRQRLVFDKRTTVMKKRLLMPLSVFILAISSSMAMAEPCPPNTQCQNQDQNKNPKTHQQPQQAHQQKQQKQPQQKQPASAQSHAQSKHEHRIVNVNSARLRSGPGTNYPVVKGLRRGDRVEVIKIENNWAQVQVDNTILWIAASLLRAN